MINSNAFDQDILDAYTAFKQSNATLSQNHEILQDEAFQAYLFQQKKSMWLRLWNDEINALKQTTSKLSQQLNVDGDRFTNALEELTHLITDDIDDQIQSLYNFHDIQKTTAYRMLKATHHLIDDFIVTEQLPPLAQHQSRATAIDQFTKTTHMIAGDRKSNFVNARHEVIKTAWEFLSNAAVKILPTVFLFSMVNIPLALSLGAALGFLNRNNLSHHQTRVQQNGWHGHLTRRHLFGFFDAFTDQAKEVIDEGKKFLDPNAEVDKRQVQTKTR